MYKRIILKLSGETLAPETMPEGSKNSVTFDESRILRAADMIARLSDMGVQVGVVMGGGNIWRGRFSEEMNAVNADQMGMLATIINALAVREALARMGRKATVFTAQEMTRFAELYRADRADACLNAGEIVLLAGGKLIKKGTPAAALRAAELRADAVFKGTTVDGVYDSDPRKNPNARLLSELTYQEALEKELKVMDSTAFRLCMEQKLPCIRVFNMDNLEKILAVARGENIGTIVHA